MKVVLASNNSGKIQELQDFFVDFSIELIPQGKLGVEEVAETGFSFVENALIKARNACRKTGLAALADDSGLVVSALKGAPGIYSARYAGPKASSIDNIQKLLFQLEQQPECDRKAFFYCVLVFMLHEQDPTPLICEGIWQGSILKAITGSGGFGYDPIFYVPEQGKSAAELPIEIKNQISHRGLALQALLAKLPYKIKQEL
ncbi:MAG TPA: RdgB/HAM1 family non-canonical purine NTP pyrophosphatase [Gammaproteobacteria bacterium]|nr:RdgB/HAM1 family non-canonical purine NTP pyrophosphatase [Gammaproteobacteria bacterium]